MTDKAFESMVKDLRERLVAAGRDPKNPPPGLPPKRALDAAIEEYKDRGGTQYEDGASLTTDLITAVGK